jgi:hypothetical protein
MALDTSKQIAFRGGTRGGGNFQFKDLGHNAAIARFREQLGITKSYKEVARAAKSDALSHLTELQKAQKIESNNRQDIHNFEMAALDTAANATANVAKQWADYGDAEVAQIGRDAESIMGLAKSAEGLMRAAGKVASDRKAREEYKEDVDTRTRSIDVISNDTRPEVREFIGNFGDLVKDQEKLKLVRKGATDNSDGTNDDIALQTKEYKDSLAFKIFQKELAVNRGIHDIDQTLDSVKTQLETEAKGAYTEREINDIAYLLTSEIHGLRGVYTPEAVKAREYLRKLEKRDENKYLTQQNIKNAQTVWDTRVIGGIHSAETVEQLEEIITLASHPDSILRNEGERIGSKKAMMEYVIRELVSENKDELAQDLMDAIPTRDGKPIAGGKDNGELYGLEKIFEEAKLEGTRNSDRKQARRNNLEGEKMLSEIEASLNLQPGDPNYEGSGADLTQRFLMGEEQPYIDWVNKKLNELSEYPTQRDAFSKRVWAETRGDSNWATSDELLEKALSDSGTPREAFMLDAWGNTATRKAISEKVEGFKSLRGIWDWGKRYKVIKGKYLIKMGRAGLQGPGAHPEGLDSVITRMLAQEYNLIKDNIAASGDRVGSVSKAISDMDAIWEDGIKNPNSYMWIQESLDSKHSYATLGNAYQDPKDGQMPAGKVLDFIIPNIQVDKSPLGLSSHLDVRSVIRGVKDIKAANPQFGGLFAEGDLYQQASTMMRGGIVRLTPVQKQVFRQLKHRVPDYTETQFLEDVLIGHGYPIQEGNMSVKDFYAVGSPGYKQQKFVEESNTGKEVRKLSVYPIALYNGKVKLTQNNAASLVIDYKNSINRAELDNMYGEFEEEVVDSFSRMQGTLGEVDLGNFNTKEILKMEPIHGYHYLKKSVIPKKGTEEDDWCKENMNGYFSWDWKNEKALANKTCFYMNY